MPVRCSCGVRNATLKRPKTVCKITMVYVTYFLIFFCNKGHALCKECFYKVFEEEVHRTVTDGRIFKRGETVAVAASGGKGCDFAFPMFVGVAPREWSGSRVNFNYYFVAVLILGINIYTRIEQILC